MLIITYMKPNLIIHSDVMLSGHIRVMDKQKHILRAIDVLTESFVSIKTKSDWPKNIEVEVSSGSRTVRKEISL